MADWDRTGTTEVPPTASVVYLELGAGVAGAFVALGFGLLLLGVGGVGVFALGSTFSPDVAGVAAAVVGLSAMGVGMTQWAWLLPLVALTFRRRRAVALGLAIGGVAISMLNGTCVAMVAAA